MRRHPALHGFSSDHHRSLVLAHHARRAGQGVGPLSVEDVWAEVRERFPVELEPHFDLEEEHLLPALEAAGEIPLVERVRKEHRVLREAARPEEENAAALKRFGERLERHIRFEEREVFPAVERLFDEEVLAAVAAAWRESGHGAPPGS